MRALVNVFPIFIFSFIRSSRLNMPSIGHAHSGLVKSESVHQLGGFGTSGGSNNYLLNNNTTTINNPTETNFDGNEKTSSVTDEFIESLVCPPPPSSDYSQLILESQLNRWVVPPCPVDIAAAVAAAAAATSGNYSSNKQQTCSTSRSTVNPNFKSFHKSQYHHDAATITAGDGGDNGDDLTTSQLDNPQFQSSLLLLATGQKSLATIAPTEPNSLTNIQYQSLIAQELNKNANNALTVSSSITPLSASPLTATTAFNSINHMQKLIRELLDTEETYCKSLEQLVTLYLEPLSQNNFLTQTDVKVLCGSILQIIESQKEFHSDLIEVGEHILGECCELVDRTAAAAAAEPQHQLQVEPTVNELGVGYIADCFLKHCANFRNYSV